MGIFMMIGGTAGVVLYLLKCLAWLICSSVIEALFCGIPGFKAFLGLINRHPFCMGVRDAMFGYLGIALFADSAGGLVTMAASLAYAGCSVCHIGFMYMFHKEMEELRSSAAHSH